MLWPYSGSTAGLAVTYSNKAQGIVVWQPVLPLLQEDCLSHEADDLLILMQSNTEDVEDKSLKSWAALSEPVFLEIL